MFEQSQGARIGYWVLTGFVVLTQSVAAVFELSFAEGVVQSFMELGYPLYLLYIIGTAKIAGSIVLAAPGLPRLKEWAYAGFVIDFSGAFFSHLLNGDGIEKLASPLVFLAIVLGSYKLRPASRRL